MRWLAERVVPRSLGAVALLGFLSGCSALGSFNALRAVEDAPGWSQSPLKEAKYDHPLFRKYTHTRGEATVTLCTSPHTVSMLGFGPPLLPILPVGLFMDRISNWPPSLFMYVQIDSPSAQARIDLSTIALSVEDRPQPLHPVYISRYGSDPRWDNEDVCGRTPDFRDAVQALQEVRGEPAKFVVRFEIPEIEVSNAELRIGRLMIGRDEVELPPIRYERSSAYFYSPLFIPPKGPGVALFGGKILGGMPDR